MPTLLVIDDDRSILHLVRRTFEEEPLEVLCESDANKGLEAVGTHKPDVILLDILLPGTTGLALFQHIHTIDRKLPVIFMTAEAGSETVIEAMQLGAFDYMAKPLDVTKLKDLVSKAMKTRHLMSVPVALGTEETTHKGDHVFIGRSPQMLDVFKAIGRVAKQNVTVLIRGESGTGKELVARALYQHSDRADEPFLEVNCAAIPDTLLESELFGHEKGAFTGAERQRIGRFEQCNGGTIFLDEIGDMSTILQGKILRLLQEQRFERVGGNQTIETDVRIVAATNRALEEMVENGEFRSDLLYRLNGVTINLAPLRTRGDDVKLLLQHFLTRATHDLNKRDIEGLSPEALGILLQHDWPGNVRELRAVIRQAVLNTIGSVIAPDFLPEEVRGTATRDPDREGASSADHLPGANFATFVNFRLQEGTRNLYGEALEMMERYLITRVLRETGGNQSRAAEILGITRGKIRDRIATFNISLDKNVTISESDDE